MLQSAATRGVVSVMHGSKDRVREGAKAELGGGGSDPTPLHPQTPFGLITGRRRTKLCVGKKCTMRRPAKLVPPRPASLTISKSRSERCFLPGSRVVSFACPSAEVVRFEKDLKKAPLASDATDSPEMISRSAH